MAWVCVNKDGSERIFALKPHRGIYNSYWFDVSEGSFQDESIDIPKGSIKKLIGRELNWDDEPVELK